MKGWRTILGNTGIIAAVSALKYVTGIDWTDHVSPTVALILTAATNIGFRIITDTAVGRKE